ncbi:MAG: hypothetical protein V7L01_00510 [Nostoc sp.]|uniref:hypothetical protein n=1 Tax=Nostoc sp. TaxID=1180 RepID=UPI002FFCC9A0
MRFCAIGFGATLSNVLAGFVVKSAGYNVAFFGSSSDACGGLCLRSCGFGSFLVLCIETKTGVKYKTLNMLTLLVAC